MILVLAPDACEAQVPGTRAPQLRSWRIYPAEEKRSGDWGIAETR
jgi:hypothetical protein